MSAQEWQQLVELAATLSTRLPLQEFPTSLPLLTYANDFTSRCAHLATSGSGGTRGVPSEAIKCVRQPGHAWEEVSMHT